MFEVRTEGSRQHTGETLLKGEIAAVLDHWVARALLSVVGIRLIRYGRSTEEGANVGGPSRGHILIMLAVATSIAAMAMGPDA